MSDNGANAVEFQVSCAANTGVIQPLHGLNCGPLAEGGMVDLSPYYSRARIPFVRLHDCHWPNADVVDIHTVFPDPDADPADPANYRFERTDAYVAAIVRTGANIVFRLGESIEHTPTKSYVHPPKDANAWAAVCVGIVRHLNEGWGGGKHYGIRYWEIWNEPENRPAMWTGTDEQFLQLYSAASKALKAHDPALRVGGPAFGYTGRVVDGAYEPSAFMRAFLNHCRADQAPLDFLSWHIYTNDPEAVTARARDIRRLLDHSGFGAAESHLNEWNYLPDGDWSPMFPEGQGVVRQRWFERMAGEEGGAFLASALILLLDAPVDMSVIYRGEVGGFSLFNTYGGPARSWGAVEAFSRLQVLPQRVAVAPQEQDGITIAAAHDPATGVVRVLLARLRGPTVPITVSFAGGDWPGPVTVDVHATAPTGELECTRHEEATGEPVITLRDTSPPFVRLVTITPTQD